MESTCPGASRALLCGLLLVIGVIVFATRNLVYLAIGLIGFALAISGTWWVITEKMPRRAIGLGGVGIGALVILVAVYRATPGGITPFCASRSWRSSSARRLDWAELPSGATSVKGTLVAHLPCPNPDARF